MEKDLVSIDWWGEGSQAYFLTHLHADHTVGLSSKWRRGTLYCSSISAKLLPSIFPAIDVSLIRVLEIGITQPVFLRSPSSGAEVRLLVTPIDAHHCPGSVMYLFQGDFGCVLHTGDFRWEIMNERAEMASKTLMDALEGHSVDALYMDNTYCHPSFSFPTREVAAHQVIDIINSYPGHEVVIGIYRLGKEDLLLHISRVLNIKIWVWPERLKTMHLLGFVDNFTTNTALTRVRAVPQCSLTYETLVSLNTLHPTIGILPSGLPWRVKYIEGDDTMSLNCKVQLVNLMASPRKLNQFIYTVQYSDHSCFSEIQNLVKLVQPLKLIGLVASSTYRTNPTFYFRHHNGIIKCRDISCKQVQNCESKQSGHLLDCKKCCKWKAKAEARNKAMSSIGRKGRVHFMRRVRFGAKIANYEELDAQP